MVLTNRTIFRIQVHTRGGLPRQFEVKPAHGAAPRLVANLYNGVLTEHDRGLAVRPRDIEARLEHDPESVHLGLLDGEPVSLINVVKRQFTSIADIPRTHQGLTDNESFISSDPDQGNMWFCPWVAVSTPGRQLRGRFGEQLKSLGQLHVLAVKIAAEEHGGVERLFAYSRPGGLKSYLEQQLNADIFFFPLPDANTALMKLGKDGGYIFAAGSTVRVVTPDGHLKTAITIEDYWNLRNERGRQLDFVFNFHAQNGAQFVPELVMPYGQVFDGTSLGFRTVLEYPMQ